MWELMEVSAETARYLPKRYRLWSRIHRVQHQFICMPEGERPSDIDGFDSIVAAIGAIEVCDNWLPACDGTEQPFTTRSGRRLLYCWQPSTGKHAYLDVQTDIILTDEEAQEAMRMTNQHDIRQSNWPHRYESTETNRRTVAV